MKRKYHDPCNEIPFDGSGNSDLFFDIGIIDEKTHQDTILHCKVKNSMYRTYALIEKESFTQFNEQSNSNYTKPILKVLKFNSRFKWYKPKLK